MTLNHDGTDSRRYLIASEFPPRFKLVRWVGRQTWLPRGQDRLLRTLLEPNTCSSFLFEVDFFGKKYRGDLAQFIDWTVFCYGSAALCELSVMEAVAAQLRKTRQEPIQYVDVGANVGHHTLFMSGVADRVLAFEPFPPLQALVNQKIALNNLANVRLVPVGLGEKDEMLDYYAGQDRNSGVGSFLTRTDGSKTDAFRLEIRNGDDFLDQDGASRVDILKVDVEGFEPFVFRGLKRRILSDRPAILTELSGRARENMGSEAAFRGLFYEDALFAEVTGRLGHRFTLKPFSYQTSAEVLIVPPELGGFLAAQGLAAQGLSQV